MAKTKREMEIEIEVLRNRIRFMQKAASEALDSYNTYSYIAALMKIQSLTNEESLDTHLSICVMRNDTECDYGLNYESSTSVVFC